MKKFMQKAQQLSQRAAQLRQAVESAPAKVAELRQTVSATTGQLLQLRSDVQATLNDLRLGSEDELIASLKEIEENADVFREAGYELSGIELELGVVQRVSVQLEKFTDTSHAAMRHSAQKHASLKSVHAILAALVRAEELADRVDLSSLPYWGLEVSLGMAPSARLMWAAEAEEVEIPVPAASTPAAVASVAASPFAQTSYFERRSPAPAPTVTIEAAPPPPAAAPLPATVTAPLPSPAPEAPTGDWRRDALARFKKMPDLSKPRR